MNLSRTIILRSNPVDPDPRVERVAGVLHEAGLQVNLLGWDRLGGLHSTSQKPWGSLHRILIPTVFGAGTRNLRPLLRWQWALLRWLARHRARYDVIHACDFDTILPALLAKSIWRKKVIYDIFDFYAEHLRATPEVLKRLIRKLDLWAIGQADAVILADECRTEQIRGSKPRKLVVIYNTPEDGLAEFQEGGYKHSALSLKLRIAFVGLLYVERGLLDLAKVLKVHPEWELDLAGFGGDEKMVAERAEALKNVRFHGRVPHEHALELMGAADVLIATYDPDIPNHRYASPNKLFEAMMLAKPIVVARGTNMDRIVEEHGFGLVIPYGDVPALEAALAKLASDSNLRARLGAAGRRAYESTYSWDIMSRRLLDLYDQL